MTHARADGVPCFALEEELMAFAGEMEGGRLPRPGPCAGDGVTVLLIDAPQGKGARGCGGCEREVGF